jgi:transposase
MISPAEGAKIYLALESVDMRKAVDGLVVLVAETLKQDPQSGHIFIFHNRSRNKIKCLVWDKNGFVLYYKRLEKRSFKVPRKMTNGCILLDKHELNWLLAGLDFLAIKQHPEFQLQKLYQ